MPYCIERPTHDAPADRTCSGRVEYRESLSGTGKPIPRCDRHWRERLKLQEEINDRYPEHPPADWSPLDAGEHWSEEDAF